ncbi:competence protein ComEC [Aneurinibacillus soli]|uniref:ComEC family competence protein n=1 Tax=Aneurinibacillus soli TaxID=1500254 RepID=A0A0U4WEH3_9BACL|nr:competence protein ComEC [Aneurinibacillus soli]BAU27160.1 ComEC family competence protein [Aneurinibacillus soli]
MFVYSLYGLGGLICAAVYTNSVKSALLVLAVGFAVSAGLFVRHAELRRCAIIGVCLFMAAFSYYRLIDSRNVSMLSVGAVTCEGEIVSKVVYDGDRVRFALRVHKVNAQPVTAEETVQVTVRLKNIEEWKRARDVFRYGTQLAGPLELSVPPEPTNPGAFDYVRFLYFQHVHRVGSIEGLNAISYQAPTSSVRGSLVAAQEWLAERLKEMYGPDTEGLLSGFLLGSVTEIDSETYAKFSGLGLTHVIAISGQHIGMFVAALVFLCRLAGLSREHSFRLTMVMLPLYVFLTGASPSAMRALIMGELVLLALLVRRRADGWNVLGVAFLGMTAVDPYVIHQVSFQLSFLVTFGLLLLVPPLQVRLQWMKPAFLRGLVAVTVAATLTSFPLTVYYFHVFSFLSPLINFLFVPFISVCIAPLAALSLVFGAIHPGFGFLAANIVDSVLTPVLHFLYTIESQRLMRIVWKSPSIIWLTLYGLLVAFIALLLYGKIALNRKSWLLCIVLALICASLPYVDRRAEVRITFLDVGQGDAIVIQTQDRVVLIDTGGIPAVPFDGQTWRIRRKPFWPAQDVILPYLYAQGIGKIDQLVMTHGDSDHIGGVPYVLTHVPVRQVISNGDLPRSHLEQEVAALMQAKHISHAAVSGGQVWEEREGVRWRVLNPTGITGSGNNDRSVVLLLEVYGRRILFTGDLEREGELRLLADGMEKVDILKVGHHGSKGSTSEEWLTQIKPDLAIISAGRNNRYGHPHRDTMERLNQADSRIVRTDECGAVTVIVNNKQLGYTTVKNGMTCR